jgi:hypothetical protein
MFPTKELVTVELAVAEAVKAVEKDTKEVEK